MKTILSLKSLLVVALLSIGALSPSLSHSAEQEVDRVAAIVNSTVVLESEVQDMIKNVKAQAKAKSQTLPSDTAIRVQVMDKLINEALILELGDRMGVQISDAQLDETILNLAKSNNMSLEQFRQIIVNDGMSYEAYRESVRNELVLGEVRRASVRRRIYISPQEVANLLETMKQQTSQNEEYNIGHILIEFPPEPKQADLDAAKKRADKVIELLNNGSEFRKIAIASSGDANALDGGSIGWKTINELPTLFAEVIDGKKKGEVFGPIRTGLGFSIVKILDVRGREVVEVEEVKARHILIKPTIILSEAKAEEMLQGFLDQIAAGEADFAELAKEHSEGPTSVRGGDLGWSDPNKYDPAFRDTLASLDIDEYSKPFRSSFGWHITQLTGRRMLDATAQMNENKAYQMLYNRKFGMESARWIKETRDEAYIEIFDQE
ncbi:peptidylprolyl isomerase SurA [Thalassotalea eurytherma]|uniref:Chaperone SurA n=1 Tax=Thalassotalea eurytherma TaxID=1144278 RepID=A0ABQ6H3U8_9GAMM|nr:peptidylprolyl isomerase SurA [Thalassotalea eurytherma]GLX82845.1 chaperone SurA [Thalassotalea eurytherma]